MEQNDQAHAFLACSLSQQVVADSCCKSITNQLLPAVKSSPPTQPNHQFPACRFTLISLSLLLPWCTGSSNMMEKGTSSDTGESAESLRSDDSLRFLAPQLGDCEEVEFYSKGGYHPTHIDDLLDNGRYHVVHKLGSGGFSTVWLARDSLLSRWVALKIVMADQSQAVEEKALMCQQALSGLDDSRFTISTQIFHIDGPNGRHLCLVLPFLGPSTYKMSQFLQSRIHPWLARSIIAQTASAVADLHSHGLCHGGEYLFS